MGVQYRKTVRIAGPLHLNISNRGISFSMRTKAGSVSSRGNASARVGKGVSYRKRLK